MPRAGGGTLNDVGLAVVAGALRTLALRHGERPGAPLKAMVPVSMRRPDELGRATASRWSTSRCPSTSPRPKSGWHGCANRPACSSTATARPPPRRWSRRPRCSQRRCAHRSQGHGRPACVHLTVSQSPAPRGALYLLGCELQEVYSVAPPGHALAYADPDALPGIHDLPALLEAELHALADTPPITPAPDARGRNGATTRNL